MRLRGLIGGLTLALALAGCGGGGGAPASPSAPAKPSAAASSTTAPSAAAASAGSAAPKPAASASAAAKPSGTLDVRIGLIPSSNTAPILVPTDDGTLAALGMKVAIMPVTDTAQAMVSVASGQLDIGSVTMGPAALNAFARGTDIKILASGGVDPPGHGAFAPVIVRTDLMDSAKVKGLGDLKGLKVGLNGKGVILEYDLYKALAQGTLTPNDVDIVTMPWPDMVVALGTKALDAGLIGQPLATQAVIKGAGKVLSDDYAPNNQNAVILTNSKFLEQHGDAVVSFLEVYMRNIRKMADGAIKKDDQALATVEKYTKVGPDITRQAPDPYWPKDGHVNVQSIQEQQAYFMSARSVNYADALDIAKLIDERPLQAALKNIGG